MISIYHTWSNCCKGGSYFFSSSSLESIYLHRYKVLDCSKSDSCEAAFSIFTAVFFNGDYRACHPYASNIITSHDRYKYNHSGGDSFTRITCRIVNSNLNPSCNLCRLTLFQLYNFFWSKDTLDSKWKQANKMKEILNCVKLTSCGKYTRNLLYQIAHEKLSLFISSTLYVFMDIKLYLMHLYIWQGIGIYMNHRSLGPDLSKEFISCIHQRVTRTLH